MSKMETLINECSRHSTRLITDVLSWINLRCSHYRGRFVVETKSPDVWQDQTPRDPTYFIDYVEDLPDGSVIVEAYSLLSVNLPTINERDTLYNVLVQKMLDNVSPDELSE